MITSDTARILITQHFVTEWADQLEYFLEGEGEPDLTTQTTPFVKLHLDLSAINQMAMLGLTPPKRAKGFIEATVFLPKMTGAKARVQAIDRLSKIFAAQKVGEVVLGDMSILSVSEGKDWRSQTVLIKFHFEQQTGA